MKKLVLVSLCFGFATSVYAGYLDDWSNDQLCGWMDSGSTPEYIKAEVEAREIICYRGAEVSYLPVKEDLLSENGTVFASPDPALARLLESTYDQGVEQTMGSSY